jgi:hypothetical protein
MEYPIINIISNEIVVNGNIEIQTTEEERENEFKKRIITKVDGFETQINIYDKDSIVDNYRLYSQLKSHPDRKHKEYCRYSNGVLNLQHYRKEWVHIFAINYSVHNNILQIDRKYYNDPTTKFNGRRYFDVNCNTITETIESSVSDILKVISYVDIDNNWDGVPKIKYYNCWKREEEVKEPIDGPLWVLPDHDLYVFENAINHLEA